MGLIYGAIDGMVITFLMSMNAGDQARAEHEAALKAWMRARHLDRRMQARPRRPCLGAPPCLTTRGGVP